MQTYLLTGLIHKKTEQNTVFTKRRAVTAGNFKSEIPHSSMTLFVVCIEWGDWVLTAHHQKCSRRQAKTCSQLCTEPYEERCEEVSLDPGWRIMAHI